MAYAIGLEASDQKCHFLLFNRQSKSCDQAVVQVLPRSDTSFLNERMWHIFAPLPLKFFLSSEVVPFSDVSRNPAINFHGI